MIEEKSMSEQRKIIHDDNNGLDYVLVGDYYIPMLALPEENRPIGYWGILRKEYLKKHKSGMYSYAIREFAFPNCSLLLRKRCGRGQRL